jgi:hypothetical protein
LYDLQNSTTLAQKIVSGLVFPITEIITIKDHKLDSIFLYIGFESQSLLKAN